jgi:hypothetical protein
MPRWRVDIIRNRAKHLGTAEEATEREAIEKAAERFEIPTERRNRIAVQKMGKEAVVLSALRPGRQTGRLQVGGLILSAIAGLVLALMCSSVSAETFLDKVL